MTTQEIIHDAKSSLPTPSLYEFDSIVIPVILKQEVVVNECVFPRKEFKSSFAELLFEKRKDESGKLVWKFIKMF